jgi:aquaporin Z
MTKKITAEFIGTLWLVLGGCGSAVLAAGIPEIGIGLLGVSLAFGLTVVTIAYAFGHVSGAHLNPAVSLGLWMGGKMNTNDLLPYIAAQILGAIAGAGILVVIATGNGKEIGDFAANGYAEHSPGGYNLMACLLTEVVMTFIFLLVILGSTDERAAKGFGGLAIGLCLALIHLISIPVTNTSVNPARSISQAVFVGDWALEQVWLFVLAPIAGALLAGALHKFVLKK